MITRIKVLIFFFLIYFNCVEFNEANSTQNLRKDILEIKKEIMSLEKEEKEIKMVIF